MTSWKMGMIVFNKDKDMSLTCRHFRDAFKNLKSAFEYGSTCMSATWKSKLEISCGKCWNDFYLCVSEIAMEQRVRTLDAVLPYLSKSNQIHAFFEIANVQFHVGINAFQKGDFKKCMYQMSECHYPIEKVKELRGFEETHHELQSLEEDVVMHLSITESSQSRQTGDDLLKMVLIDEETLNIEMVWDIIDWYRQAIVLTRDLDMEMEAIALSRLGVVYDKVLKLKPKAKECFMASVRLAESMHPRTFNTTDWYIESTSTLKRYQQETVQHEEEEKAKERAEIKEKMKEELNALDKDNSNMQNKEFLKHLYNKYKPKNSNHIFEEFNEDSSVETKKRLQKAIVHFHPDKVNAEEHGWEWKIMTEEITKYLTRRYEVIKAEI
ncbi:hypothetical protein KUTeg_016276 [Tegillarca granosa]|uniref:J domain-containing protein n=1 Tax=Tegillarca granosa TaxID=220873 RepID=A0ABQ9EMX6_TEGGR|nr:hypothetical protein KUTeg_016276 [Tegillarca granosa]